VNAIVGSFAATWAVYFVLLALLPIRYVSAEMPQALIVLGIYVGLTLTVALWLRSLHASTPRIDTRARLTRPLSVLEVNHLVLLGMLASAVGIMLIAYVRISVQGIDFTQGLAVARELWRNEGEERTGVASPLSIPGYGLGFFFLASTFIGHLHWEQITKLNRLTLLFSTVLFVAGYSVLTGGRSILLLQLISLLSAGAVRRAQGRLGFPGRFWRNAISGFVVFLVAISYVLYIFSDRAAKSGVSADVYALGMISYMGGAAGDGFRAISFWPEPAASITYFAVISGGYITHSVGTLASVMEYSSHPGITTFIGVQGLLARLGVLDAPDDTWALAGAFLSFPGAFWYEYGLPGVIAVALVTGSFLGATSRFVIESSGGGFSLAFVAGSMIVAISSPLLFAPDQLAFPFMVLGYVGLSAYSRVRFGVRNWWRVGHQARLERVLEEHR
jgi:hypothetical protein